MIGRPGRRGRGWLRFLPRGSSWCPSLVGIFHLLWAVGALFGADGLCGCWRWSGRCVGAVFCGGAFIAIVYVVLGGCSLWRLCRRVGVGDGMLLFVANFLKCYREKNVPHVDIHVILSL